MSQKREMSCCWNCGKETIGLKKVRLIDKSAETEIAVCYDCYAQIEKANKRISKKSWCRAIETSPSKLKPAEVLGEVLQQKLQEIIQKLAKNEKQYEEAKSDYNIDDSMISYLNGRISESQVTRIELEKLLVELEQKELGKEK